MRVKESTQGVSMKMQERQYTIVEEGGIGCIYVHAGEKRERGEAERTF